ncbi:MAG TPA: hypothetical protein VKT73_11665 [Xanthobacteraceae bacterium]|nr:hypothetical protein [Xanthobacteraceae bacterium]
MSADSTDGARSENREHATARSDRRVILALAMVVVAILGAFIAYLTAKTEYEAAVLERRLTQGHMLELEYRQSLLDRGAKRETFDLRRGALIAEAKQRAQLADEIRKDDPRRAQLLELEAGEDFMRARALQPFLDFLPNPFDAGLSIEQSLTKRAARRLQSMGFPVSWEKPGANDHGASASIWRRLLEMIEMNHEKLPRLALAVAFFVLALFFFALADVFFEKERGTRTFALFAIVISLATIAYLMSLALAIWIKATVLAATLVTIALGLLGLRKGLPSWLSASGEATHLMEAEPHGFAGSHLVSRHAHDNFSRLVAVAIAATVLLSAWAGYRYSDATTNMSQDALKGFEQQVEMTKRSSRPNAATLYVFDLFADALDRRAECAASLQREALAAGGKLMAGADELRAEQELRCKAVSSENKRIAETLDGPAGLESDRKFPQQFYYDVVHGSAANNPFRAYALWDGYSELALVWGGKATSYLSVLTLCAIAVYFFGQSLSIGTSRLAKLLAGAGGAFVACALIFTGLASLDRGHRSAQSLPEECRVADKDIDPEAPASEILTQIAAFHYARGRPLFENARSAADYQEAAKAFDCAVRARRDFGLAYVYLGSAYALAGSPQSDQAYLSIRPKEKLPHIVKIRRRAIKGLQRLDYFVPPNVLNSYGADSWHLAVAYGDRKALENSTVQFQRAIEAIGFLHAGDAHPPGAKPEPLQATELLPHLNLALASLTAGNAAEALTRFKQALALGAAGNWELITTALTTFEVLDQNCPNLYSAERCQQMKTEILAAKEAMVAGIFDKPLSPGNAAIHDVTINVSPAIVEWRGTIENFTPGTDQLAIVWSVRDKPAPGAADTPVWRALPDVGGAVNVSNALDFGNDVYAASESFLRRTDHEHCLPPGDYRAEFYLNGKLALEKEFSPGFKDFDAGRSREINIALCKPAAWKAWLGPETQTWNPELVRGYTTADGKPAAFLASYLAPPALVADEGYFLQRILQSLQTYKFITPEEANEFQAQPLSCDDNPAPDAPLLQKQWTGDGLVYVGIVFPKTLAAGEACDLMRSIGNIVGPLNR